MEKEKELNLDVEAANEEMSQVDLEAEMKHLLEVMADEQ